MQQEYKINAEQLVADIDEKIRELDEHIDRVKLMLSSQEIDHYEDRALFHAVNLMLKERSELAEKKERALSDGVS